MRRAGALLTMIGALAIACVARADTGQPSPVYPNTTIRVTHWATHPRVQSDPVVYLIFLGPRWTSDTTGVIPAELTLFRELPGSTYNAILGQYGVHNDTRLDGVFLDPATPQRVTLTTLSNEVARVGKIKRWSTGRDVQWVVLPQANLNLHDFADSCGAHDGLEVHHRPYYIDLIPSYQDPNFASCIYDYSADNGLRAPGDLVDATTSITTHEYAEQATDPALDGATYGWSATFAGAAEIADLCAWSSGTPAGMTVNVSYLWSNSLHTAVDGCTL